jgi:predicted hydrocarbon binding protein
VGEPKERLGRRARVRAAIPRAHLSWARKRWGAGFVDVLTPHLDPEGLALVRNPPAGADAMVLFSTVVRLDRALATAAGENPEAVFYALGVHSAEHNLKGVYDHYDPETTHEFFDAMRFVHRTFQDFGKSSYERLGERAGRMRIERYPEFSPVFCISGRGYYAEALRMMKAPGPVVVREVGCHCLGEPACVFELSW